MGVLIEALKAADNGERRVVLVAGEPGVGKTRLVAAAARRAHDDGALVLFGRCEEDLAVAYQPFAEALRVGLPHLDDATLRAHVGVHGGELRRLVPVLDAPEPIRAEVTTEQARLFGAVSDLLHRAAEERLTILVLDDLHWAVPATVALLRHLLTADRAQRLCLLGTYRDTEVDRAHALGGLLADLHRIEGSARLALRGLDSQGVEDMLATASGDELDEDGQALAAAVEARTAGNPFFAGQVLRHLVERSVLVQREGRWKVHGALAELDLPEGGAGRGRPAPLPVVRRPPTRPCRSRPSAGSSSTPACSARSRTRDRRMRRSTGWTRRSVPACSSRPDRGGSPSPTRSCGTPSTGS